MLNEATFEIIGRLTHAAAVPENEAAPVELAVAVNTVRGSGEDRTEYTGFFDAVSWNKGVRALASRGDLASGRMVRIKGRLDDHRWEAEGQKRKRIQLIALDVNFLDPRPA